MEKTNNKISNGIRVTAILSKEQAKYLKKKTKDTEIPMSSYIKMLIEEDMRNEEERKARLNTPKKEATMQTF